MKKLYLVDVSSMIFRAFFAIRPLSAPNGTPVNAIYGFMSMVIKLLKQEKPEYIVFCYDRKEPSFRKDLYKEYKANRSEMPDDLQLQMPYLKKVGSLLGIPDLEVPSYEADDLIGTLTELGVKNKMEVFIVSGDKDFGQLIRPHVYLYDTMKNVKYDVDGVKEKWGVPPEKFIDYLALVGDSSDNIPGVSGIGPKGACKLLEQFNSVEDIYKNIDKVEGKSTKEKLIASKEDALLSKKLVSIVTDVELDQNIEAYKLKPLKREELRKFLQDLNLKSLEKTMLGEESIEQLAPTLEARTNDEVLNQAEVGEEPTNIKTKAMDLAQVSKWLKKNEEVWGFIETRGLFLAKENHLVHVQDDLKKLGSITDELNIQWKGFDAKNFWHQINCKNPFALWDSMLAAYVVRAGDTGDFNALIKEYLGHEHAEFVTPDKIYNSHLKLETYLKEQLVKQGTEKVLAEYDIPLSPILYRMEKRGILLDKKFLEKQSKELEKEVFALEKEIHKVSGETFNVASPKQLAVVLFEKLKLPAGKKTKTGYSTDNEVLAAIEHPIADLVLQYRELSKLKSTYVDALPHLADEKGRIHTTFNQALTATGRLSSINPNLQNIPIRTERGQQVRKAFIADKGHQLLSVDYSQIELRILAHITEDPGLMRAFAEDLDVHAATAAEIFNIKLKDVTSEHRRKAKAVNFGIAYGQGVFGLAETLKIPRAEAQEIIKRYFDRFKRVREYIDSTVASAEEKGYVETLCGRRRYIPELQSKSHAMKKFGERAAINAPIQGTASDLMKKAMIDVDQNLKKLDMLLQVHDELIFEGAPADIAKEQGKITDLMEHVTKLKVPLKVNAGSGENWDEAH
jgi:DNA polymerase-1